MRNNTAKLLLLAAILAVCAACAVFFLIPYAQNLMALSGHERWSDVDRAYQWFLSGQRENRQFGIFHNGLIPSQEGGDTCFVYDEALAAMVFTLRGDYDNARLIFRFFDGMRKRHIAKYGSFRGFTDTYKKDGREVETRAAGPNAWVLMALNYYHRKAGMNEFMPLAHDIARWLMTLRSIEGGLIGGYYGNGNPMAWISTEHNFDSYAAFRDLGVITREESYLRAAKEVEKWLEDEVWSADAKRFYLGRRNPNYATDLSSWAVLSLGTRYSPSLEFAMDKSLNKQTYKVKNVEVEGFDFGSTYKDSPFPDKDAVWFEGTGHMILAFAKAGKAKEGAYFLKELDKCVTDSPLYRYTKGLPYASNEGTPVYDSWLMQDKPLCVASTAWYIFAHENFNPFSAFTSDDEPNKAVKALQDEIKYQFSPMVDDFEYSDIQFRTAYPDDMIITHQANVSIDLTKELSADNGRSMKVTFTPDTGVKTAIAIIRRPFLYKQDWSTHSHLNLWVYSTGSRNSSIFANLGIKDREGEVYQSPPIFLNRSGWQQYSFDLWADCRRDPYDGVTYGDCMLGLSKIIEISVSITAKNPIEETLIYIDKIELVRENN